MAATKGMVQFCLRNWQRSQPTMSAHSAAPRLRVEISGRDVWSRLTRRRGDAEVASARTAAYSKSRQDAKIFEVSSTADTEKKGNADEKG